MSYCTTCSNASNIGKKKKKRQSCSCPQLIKHYTMKAYGKWMHRSMFSWSRHCLEVSGQLYAPATLPPEKEAWFPLDGRLGGPQNRSGQYGELKILHPTGTPRLLNNSLYWMSDSWGYQVNCIILLFHCYPVVNTIQTITIPPFILMYSSHLLYELNNLWFTHTVKLV
jgi:hypothetical protein